MEPIKVNHWIQYINEHPNFTGCLIDSYNDIAWYKDGKRHRDDGPAIECANGNKEWLKNGKMHREDGPSWECANGDKLWYLNDKQYAEQEWLITMRKIKLEKVLKRLDNENNTLL